MLMSLGRGRTPPYRGGLNGGSSLTARDLPALVNKGDSHEAFQQPDRNRNRTPSYRKGWDLIPMFYAKDSKGNEYKGKSLRYDYMSCLNCRKWGDHWTIYCPNKAEEAPKSERKRKRKRKLKHKHKRKRQESTCDNTSGAKVGLGSQTDKTMLKAAVNQKCPKLKKRTNRTSKLNCSVSISVTEKPKNQTEPNYMEID
ncbi:hypothetical protein M0R45_005023 [Rubus argutus]|uniref:Uncharacterized protein n=1 Tax=Rubus argutus TaxID=59490 RepID=A0AAW1YLE8_RUBAR